MKYLTIKEQLREERIKNEKLTAETAKTRADIDYVAMMTDVDIDKVEDEENE